MAYTKRSRTTSKSNFAQKIKGGWVHKIINLGVPSVIVTLQNDTGTPGDLITQDGLLKFTGRIPGSTIAYSTDGGTTWSGTFTPVQGVNAIQVKQTVNGRDSDPTPFTFTLDNVNPAPTVVLNDDTWDSTNFRTTDGNLLVTGAEPGETFEYSVDGGTNWTSSFTAVIGINDVKVREIDKAGNKSPATAIHFSLVTTCALPDSPWRDYAKSIIKIPDSKIDDFCNQTSIRGWFQRAQIVDPFPMVDTSNIVDWSTAFLGNNFTSFPALDTSSATDLSRTWMACQKLTSFPLIDTSKVTHFENAWQVCGALTTFPRIDLSSAAYMKQAWDGCILDDQSILNILDELNSLPIAQIGVIASNGGCYIGSKSKMMPIQAIRDRVNQISAKGLRLRVG